MVKPEVYFIKGFDKKAEEKFLNTLKSEISKVFKSGESVAIKMHLGEPGNTKNIQPDFVAKVVKVFDELGIDSFIFDSPTMYEGPRHTVEAYEKSAKERGYTKVAKVVISDDFIKQKGKFMAYEVCKPLAEADGVLILSHVKGHGCAGFGASIKNLGMGALTAKSKTDIHAGGKPNFNQKLCEECGTCEKKCNLKNISCKNGKPEFGKTRCFGCSNCAIFCPSKAITTKVSTFDNLLSDGAYAALKNFKKYLCVNVMNNITEKCDCFSDPGKAISKDVGLIIGKDLVSIDKASYDLIKKENKGVDVFEKIHLKSPLLHIQAAHELGAGSLEYELKEVK
jgi:uncharacterized Fe-S center protein